MVGTGTRRRLEPKELHDMVEMAKNGCSVAQIAKTFNLNWSSVQYRLEKAGVTAHVEPRYVNCGKGRHATKSGSEVMEMIKLQQQGLSNRQIAMELGCAPKTVNKYLGKQKAGSRSAYGSIVAHADGESFVHEQLPEKEEPIMNDYYAEPAWVKELKKVQIPEEKKPTDILAVKRSVITYEGQDLLYKVDTDGVGAIYIRGKSAPDTIMLTLPEFNHMLEELMALIDKLPEAKKEA